MVKIKKHSLSVLYISATGIGGLLFLSSMYFIMDHKFVIDGGCSWLFWVVPTALITIYILINLFYNLCAKTHYEFRENEIVLIKKGQIEKSIKLVTIVKSVYEKISIDSIFGAGRFGELLIIYKENDEIYRYFIEIPFRMLKKTYLYQKHDIIIGS